MSSQVAAAPARDRTHLRGFRALLPVLLLVAAACTGGSGPDDALGVSAVSKPLPRLSGKALPPHGGTVDTDELRSDVLVVNFWATWCGPCRREQPILQELWQRYEGRGVTFLGVAQKDDPAAASAQLEEFDVTYPSLSDEAGSYADDFGFIGLPDTYVVDRTGTIRYQVIGPVHEPSELSALIDELLAAG
jgi:cytochrome c biogenesis protein CcmG/thiol:disulfide interchange protein DsbE